MASLMNSCLRDMVVFSFHGIGGLLCFGGEATVKKCYLCPRTPVTHVPGLYKGQGEGGQSLSRPRRWFDLTLSLSCPGEGTYFDRFSHVFKEPCYITA